MLTKTLQIAAICFSMANPSNFHIEQTKKANDYTINLKNTFITSQIGTDNTLSYPKYAIAKWGLTSIQNEFLINEKVYANSFYEDANGPRYAEATNGFEQTSNSILHAIQISPYRPTTNNTIQLAIKISLNDTPNGNYNDSYTLVTEVYTSTETFWQNYIDQTTLNKFMNYDTIQAITNPQMGFMYGKDIYTQTLTERNNGGGQQNLLIETNLNVDPNKNNYFYILTYLTYETSGQVIGNIFTIAANHVFVVNDNTNDVVITGNWIPSIGNYEVIDIPGIMWEVLTMPFTFISIAFNLTIFPNTPYQINLSNLFLSIIGIIIFAWILQKFIKKV